MYAQTRLPQKEKSPHIQCWSQWLARTLSTNDNTITPLCQARQVRMITNGVCQHLLGLGKNTSCMKTKHIQFWWSLRLLSNHVGCYRCFGFAALHRLPGVPRVCRGFSSYWRQPHGKVKKSHSQHRPAKVLTVRKMSTLSRSEARLPQKIKGAFTDWKI